MGGRVPGRLACRTQELRETPILEVSTSGMCSSRGLNPLGKNRRLVRYKVEAAVARLVSGRTQDAGRVYVVAESGRAGSVGIAKVVLSGGEIIRAGCGYRRCSCSRFSREQLGVMGGGLGERTKKIAG